MMSRVPGSGDLRPFSPHQVQERVFSADRIGGRARGGEESGAVARDEAHDRSRCPRAQRLRVSVHAAAAAGLMTAATALAWEETLRDGRVVVLRPLRGGDATEVE